MSPKTTPSNPPASRANPPHKSYRYIALIFVVLAILLVLAVTYLALSKVTITLTPADEQISYDFTLIIAENPENITSTELILEGKVLSEQAKVSQEFLIQEGKRVDAQAEGSVTIYNDRNQSQTLVATTRLLTPDNILFRLKDQVTIPANSQVQARVYADKEGPSGNVSPTIFTIPGLSESLQKLVYAKSTSSMTGGTRQIGVLTTQELEKDTSELIKNKSGDIMTRLIDSLENDKLSLIDTQITSSELSPNKELGEQVDSFTLAGNLKVTAVFALREQILNLAKDKLKESRGPKGEFINVDPSSLKYELIEADPEKGEAKIKVEISGLSTFDPDKDIFDKNLLVGFTEDDLKLYFSQFESIESIQVKFSPFWVKKVPILKDHIYIQVAGE